MDVLVCPMCRGGLQSRDEAVICIKCARQYFYKNGFLDFLTDEGFGDETDSSEASSEEKGSEALVIDYLIPLFERLYGRHSHDKLKILAVGCGVASEVDTFIEHGFECWGVDCGSRVMYWNRRKYKNRLLIASGKNLPFEDDYFDTIVSFGVIEHIGVVGDTTKTAPSFWMERHEFADELIRVTKKGGDIILSCPNRLFPIDFFHKEDNFWGKRGIRFHSPYESFLLSVGDIRKLFKRGGVCSTVVTLPLTNYFRFQRSVNYPLLKILVGVGRLYLRLLSVNSLSFLRESFLNPFLIVRINKE